MSAAGKGVSHDHTVFQAKQRLVKLQHSSEIPEMLTCKIFDTCFINGILAASNLGPCSRLITQNIKIKI